MLKVIFVDDETPLLSGLKRSLRSMRKEWDMEFISEPKEALEFITQNSIDVLVTDLRMPAMNGAELLRNVVEVSPNCIRIVLSGEVGTSLVYETLGVAHRFLSKPSSADDICAAIKSSISMKEYLLNDDLLKIVNGIKELPTIPAIYEELVDTLKSPDVPVSKLGEIIKKDLGLTAKVLKVVNSAFFGLRNNVTDPVMAVNYLGIEAIKSLALSVKAFEDFGNKDLENEINKIWTHSELVAIMCRQIAESEKMTDPEVEMCYMTGLLHDIGYLIIAENFPEKYQGLAEQFEKESLASVKEEIKLFGATHNGIGAYLLGLWNLDHAIIEAVAYHHEPMKAAAHEIGPLAILHVADAFAYGFEDVESFKERVDFEYLAKADCFKKLPVWKQVCAAALEEAL